MKFTPAAHHLTGSYRSYQNFNVTASVIIEQLLQASVYPAEIMIRINRQTSDFNDSVVMAVFSVVSFRSRNLGPCNYQHQISIKISAICCLSRNGLVSHSTETFFSNINFHDCIMI